MSVEIDVGLENAASVKVSPAEPPQRPVPSEPLLSPKIKRGLILGGIVLAAVSVQR